MPSRLELGYVTVCAEFSVNATGHAVEGVLILVQEVVGWRDETLLLLTEAVDWFPTVGL